MTQALLNPLAYALIADAFAPERRASANAVCVAPS